MPRTHTPTFTQLRPRSCAAPGVVVRVVATAVVGFG